MRYSSLTNSGNKEVNPTTDGADDTAEMWETNLSLS